MNEELKILIKATTTEAKKNLAAVKKELENIDKQSDEAGRSLDKAMRSVAKSAAVAIGSIAAISAAMTKLGQSAQQVQKGFEKLNTTFQNAGATAAQATSTYKNLFGFLGDHDKAVETAQSLALITAEEEKMAEWTQILKGAWAEMGDKLPIEGLAEAANETINVGNVVGVMADALTWAGISEEGFNQALANTTSLAEREALVRNTLNGLYGNSAKLYDANNKATIEYNKQQASLNITLGRLAQYLTPLLTSFVSLGNVMLTVLAPAIRVVATYLTAFIQLIVEAIQWVGSFFGLFQSKTETTTADVKGYQNAMNSYMNSLQKYFGGTSKGVENTEKKIKDLKKQVMGFDELNVVSNLATADTGASGAGGIGAGGALPAAPNPADYKLDSSGIDLESFKKDLADTKKLIKEILAIAAPIAALWGLWKLSNFILDLTESIKLLKKFKTLDMVEQVTGSAKMPESIKMVSIIKDKITAPFVALKGFIASIVKALGVGVGGGLAIIAAVLVAIGSAVYFLYKNWDAVVQAVKDFFAENIAPKLETIKKAFSDLGISFDGFGEAIGKVFEWIGKGFEWLGGIVVGVLGGVIAGAINGFVQFISGIVGMITGWFNIIAGIIKAIVALFTRDSQKAKEAAKQIVDGVFSLFKGMCDSTIGVIVEFVKGIVSWFTKMWDILVGHSIVPDMIEAIIKWFKELPGKLFGMMADFVKKIIAYFSDLAKQAGAKASEMWTKVKQPFMNVASWFKSIFKQAWDNIKSVFSGISAYFSGIWNTIKGIFSKVGTSIASGVTGAVKGAINSVLTSVTNKINTFIGWINGAVKMINKIPGVEIGTISKLSVPKLATGGITTGATMAMIGERGREAVLPLENNTGWMDALADRIAARNNLPSKIVLKVGEKELGWATINSINGITKQTGGLQLHLV